jgi:hypothetical protein
MADYEVKQHDTGSLIEVTLTDAKGPVNLGTAEAIHIYMRSDTKLVKTGAMEVVDAEAGEVAYTWEEGDLDDPGDYKVEFEIIWESGGKTTIPNAGYKSLTIHPDLGEPGDLE